jgi:putative membrane protein
VTLLIRLLINAAALWVAAQLVSGIALPSDWRLVLVVALVFGALNAVMRPVLLILSIPLLILTLGLFTFVVNAIMLMLTSALSGALGLGFRVDGFWPALLGSLVVSIVSIALNTFVASEARPPQKNQ